MMVDIYGIGFCSGLAVIIVLVIYKIYLLRGRRHDRSSSSFRQCVVEKDPYRDIEPLPDFDWAETPPIQNAIFKPRYHLTMGRYLIHSFLHCCIRLVLSCLVPTDAFIVTALEKITLSDILALDNTYAERMQVRKSIIDEHQEEAISCNPVCEAAVLELHDWIFGTYLPTRFPKTYQLNTAAPERSLYNTANSKSIPLTPSSPIEALRALGEHVDTDFLLLLPSSQAADGSPLYHLQAFVCCCPAGFNLRQKLGLPLSGIHGPVPGYKSKLEKPMDRFFSKLEYGRAVKRSNWAIATDDVLFHQGGSHLHITFTGEEKEEELEQQRREVVVENCRIRSERQTLMRLPKTGAIVFSFKTYMYKLSEAKEGGSAEALIEAIRGLKTGNVPEINHYKRGEVWAEPVIEYLKS